MMSSDLAYAGTDIGSQPPRLLRAGPLELLYESGMIRSIMLGERELVRRVYVAIRDQFWNTIRGTVQNERINSSGGTFTISFDMRHTRQAVDFTWHGEIRGSLDGTVSFTMSGQALSSFKRNRIGICVLFPIIENAGQPCSVEKTDGSTAEARFPDLISPFQPFLDVRSLTYDAVSGTQVTVRMEGDTFEVEDQRNWTDTSYKAYSTPLSFPIPVLIESGNKVDQSITIKLSRPVANVQVARSTVVDLRPQDSVHRVPQIGVCIPGVSLLTPQCVERIHQLAPSHVRIEAHADSETLIAELEEAASVCRLLNTPAEIAAHFGSASNDEVAHFVQVLRATQVPMRRILVFRKNQKTLLENAASTIIPALRELAPSIQIGAGTDSYFVEINRKRPPLDNIDLLCYSVNPQVHTFDDVAVMENLPGQFETLRTARDFCQKPLALTPITLRPRPNPEIPQKDGGPDPRQVSLFCAAWTAGSVLYCSQGNAASLTYYDAVGPGGLMSQDGDMVYPAYHVLASICEFSDGTLVAYKSSDAKRVVCLALNKGISFLLLVANLTKTPQQAVIRGLPDFLNYTVLDQATFEEATMWPEQWRCKRGEHQATRDGRFELLLEPYAVARLEMKVPR